jgi:hypothetical protein
MKMNQVSAIALTTLSSALFYAVSFSSMLEPYAPSTLASVVMRYGVAAAIVGVGLYFGFFFKWPSWGDTSWGRISRSLPTARAKRLKMAVLVASLVIFAAIVAFGTQRWMAYPTKWIATESVSTVVRCESALQWGKGFRRVVMVKAANLSTGEKIEFPWPTSAGLHCPGSFLLNGRRSRLGIYVTAVLDSKRN